MEKQSKQQLREQRNRNMKRASYFGIALALFVIGMTGVIIWVVNTAASAKVISVGDIKVNNDLYTCVYYCDTMTSDEWKKYGFDVAQDPYEQEFNYMVSNKQYDSWGAFFEGKTNETLRFFYSMKTLADQGGYVYSDDVSTKINDEMASVESEKPIAKKFSIYMSETYGAAIKKEVFEQYLELYYQSTEFYKAITENKALFEQYLGSEFDSLEEVYSANEDTLDVVSFRYYSLTDNHTYAKKIEALKTAKSEKAFRDLCNSYKNDDDYTKKDSSLYQNVSLAKINNLSESSIAKKITSKESKAGDIYYADSEEDGKPITEVVYLVKARAKNENDYNESEVKMWEYGAMGVVLNDYAEKYHAIVADEKGMEYFKRSMGFSS